MKPVPKVHTQSAIVKSVVETRLLSLPKLQRNAAAYENLQAGVSGDLLKLSSALIV